METDIEKLKHKFLKVFEENGFYETRMISGSKSRYKKMYPKHKVIFNAQVFEKDLYDRYDRKEIEHLPRMWCGDLDITIDLKKLQKCSEKTGSFVITSEGGADEAIIFPDNVSYFACLK